MRKGNARRAFRDLEREVEQAVDTRPPGIRRREARRRAVASLGAPGVAGGKRTGRAASGVRRPKVGRVTAGRPYAIRPSDCGVAPRRRRRLHKSRRTHDRRDSHAVGKRTRRMV